MDYAAIYETGILQKPGTFWISFDERVLGEAGIKITRSFERLKFFEHHGLESG